MRPHRRRRRALLALLALPALSGCTASAPGDDGGAVDSLTAQDERARDDAAGMDSMAPAMDAGTDSMAPAMDAADGGFAGTPCVVAGTAGVCLDVGACAGGRAPVPGHCPGPANIQCCVATADAAAPDWDARATGCPADMVALPGYCMDRYEAPNMPGVRPLAFQTAADGAAWCAARGRRLCTEAEWVTACEGARGYNYPYGAAYGAHTCNDDQTWIPPDWTALGTYPSDASMAEARRLYQAEASGARSGCRSEQGVMDLTGNVAEWVVRSFPNANNYDHVMKGCYWSGCFGGSPPSCSFVNPAHPGTFRTYEAGFRCCLTP